MSSERRTVYGFIFAAAYCAAAIVLVLVFGVHEPFNHAFEIFVLGVVATAAFFSWRPAIVLWAVSVPVSMYFLLPPAGFEIMEGEAYRLGFYSIVCWAVILSIKREQDLAGAIEQRAADLVRERDQGIDQSHDALIACDPNRRITRWNLGAVELYGWKQEEALGRKVEDLLNTHSQTGADKIYEAVFRGGRWEGVLTHTTRDGREVQVESRHVLIRNASGKAVGFLEINRDITAAKRAEQLRLEAAAERERLLVEAHRTAAEMARNRAQLEAVFHGVSDGIVVFDMRGNAVLVNEAEARINGYESPADMMRDVRYFTSVYELLDVTGSRIPVEDWPVSHALQGEAFSDRELRGRRTDTGQEWYFSFSGGPVRDDEGEQILAVVVTRDITERWRAREALRAREQALRESEERLQTVIENISDGLVVTDPTGSVLQWNRAALEMHGFKGHEPELSDMSALAAIYAITTIDDQFVPVESWPIPRILRGERLRDWEIKLRRKDIDWLRVLSYTGEMIREADGQPVLGVLTIRDITRQKEAQQAVRESEERLRLAVRAANEGIWEWNIRTGVTTFNETYVEAYGRPEPGQHGRAWWLDRIHPADRQCVQDSFREAVESASETWMAEYRILKQDGEWADVIDRAAIARDEHGKATRIAGAMLDQTDRKRAEAAVRESELRERARAEELEAVLDAIPAAVFVARDADCRFVAGNHTTYELLRLQPGTNISAEASPGFRLVRGGADIPINELPLRIATRTGLPVRNFEFDVILPDGAVRSLLGDALPLKRGDAIGGAVGVFLDVTERKRSEERLRQAQKLESIGILAGGVAHDFNNLLAGIMGNASLLEDELGDRNRDKARAIIQASERAAGLTRQLLAYAGKGRFVVEPLDLSKLVQDMAALLHASIPKKVRLGQDLASALPAVESDPGQVQQIVMNLLLNAAEAIPENQAGLIDIRTRVAEVGAHEIVDEVSGTELKPGTYVVLEVRDTGSGMDPQTRARIFDPFFTTKFTGRGLGLPAVAGVVRSHHGAVQVITGPGAGTTFRVFLPAAPRKPGPKPAPERTRGLRGGSILVVDDEEVVLDFARAALEAAGFRVMTAADGLEAIDIFDQHPGEIDIVLLDLMMPVMDGNETAAALRQKRHGVPIALMSGFSEVEAARFFSNERLATFIQKPFTARQLVDAVEAALAAAGY